MLNNWREIRQDITRGKFIDRVKSIATKTTQEVNTVIDDVEEMGVKGVDCARFFKPAGRTPAPGG